MDCEEKLIEKMKNIDVKIRSGSSLVKVRPLFSHNSKCLIVASGPNVKLYNVQSCECLHTLRYHKTDIISLQENKNNCLQFYSCSQDGVIVRWEVVEGTLLKVFNLNTPVVNFYAPMKNDEWFVTKKFQNEDEYRLYAVNNSKHLRIVSRRVLPHHNAVAFGFEGSFVASIYENSLCIYMFETNKFVRHLTGIVELKCVTCHPSQPSVATGDSLGRVEVWSNIFDTKKPIRSIYHWHTLPVADLSFSSEGSYLYSGGEEASLVKWNLFSEERSILPRLGAAILWVKDSLDSSLTVTALEDNSLQLIDPHRNVVGLIQGLTRGHFRGNPKQHILSTGLMYDPQTKSLVLNGKPGHLQFYSIFEDKHLFNLDISAKNFITHEREHLSYNVDVSKAAIDSKGQWLATVEYWCNDEVSPMIWLKFWEYNMNKQIFVMNTNIQLPHDKEVNCIAFRPYETTDTPPLAVTTSNDCRFKTWSLFDDSDFEGKQSWNCSSMNYYREHLPTGDVSYSEDGSVLAIAVNNIATLWTDNNTHLKAVLYQEKEDKPIKQLQFGRGSCKHLLVCHDGSKIYVWNVLSHSIIFRIHVNVQTIAVDMTSELVAVFSKDDEENYQNLYLFKPNDPNPIYIKKNASDKPILSALFVPKSIKNQTVKKSSFIEKSQLYFFDEDQHLFTLTDECDDDLDSNINKIKISSSLPMTPFGFLQAETKVSGVQAVEPQYVVVEKGDSEKDSWDYPNPTYLDHFTMCTRVLQKLLRPKPPQETDSLTDINSDIKIKQENKDDEPLDNPIEISTDDMMDVEVSVKKEEPIFRVTDFSFLKNVKLLIS